MAADETGCNGSGTSKSPSFEKLITYKRRKRANGCVSPPAKALKEIIDQDLRARMDRNWKIVLEHMQKFPDLSDNSGIHKCIQDALTSVPFESTKRFKMTKVPDVTPPEGDCKDFEVDPLSKLPDSTINGTSVGSKSGTCGDSDICSSTIKCQNVFLDILLSPKFASLCDLLCVNFQHNVVKSMFDFSRINSKMKDGVYEQSSRIFGEDILQIWGNFQKVGQEMVNLAKSLISISQASYKKQVGEDLLHENDEPKCEGSGQAVIEEKNSVDSYTTSQFPSYESDRSNRLTQTEGSCLYKVCTCKHCGNVADGKNSLICDGCEAMYHVFCTETTEQKIPTQSWYCISCSTKRNDLPNPLPCGAQQDSLHQNCVVCDRLEVSVSEDQNHPKKNGKEALTENDRESSVSSMESDEPLEPSTTAVSRLCKHCGTCEDEDRRFLTCGNMHCLYKFYHIRCLKSNQIASRQQQSHHCWYCPSCLCRACLADKDDDKIVMCDGCDEAYHIYCMKPPRTSIPEGKWFCIPCNVKRARQGMRLYEQWVLNQHGKKELSEAKGAKRSVDVLLSAAAKLSSEEKLAAGKI
ncbi:hypothetical protein J5N97_021163 [Dioscorea zingiberensis]|uniref:PHD-type domain-containing protein n=1 Tax=Dioscorea zingiberensis TaxID=325984 RepID=A0A9D5HE20_9LILI|nr:hypothetical protein J5N97_021163 [Dioscorea zingiberensis]